MVEKTLVPENGSGMIGNLPGKDDSGFDEVLPHSDLDWMLVAFNRVTTNPGNPHGFALSQSDPKIIGDISVKDVVVCAGI